MKMFLIVFGLALLFVIGSAGMMRYFDNRTVTKKDKDKTNWVRSGLVFFEIIHSDSIVADLVLGLLNLRFRDYEKNNTYPTGYNAYCFHACIK